MSDIITGGVLQKAVVTASPTSTAIDRGVVIYQENTVGTADATYDASDDVIINSGSATITGGSYNLDAHGYAYSNGTSLAFLTCQSVPAKATAFRKYEFVARSPSTLTDDDLGPFLLFNYQDGNNLWYLYLLWDNPAGRVYVRVDEIAATVTTTRIAATQFPAAITGADTEFHVTLYDGGDSLVFVAHAYEEGNPADTATITAQYTVGSRPLQNQTLTQLGTVGAPGTAWTLKSLKISDVGDVL